MDILDKVEVADQGGKFHMLPFQDLEVELTLILFNQLTHLQVLKYPLEMERPC